MNNSVSPAQVSGTIRINAFTWLVILLPLLHAMIFSSNASAQDAGQSATISIDLLNNAVLRDPNQPATRLGTLEAGSQVSITLPPQVAAQLNGRPRISNVDLLRLLNQLDHTSYRIRYRNRAGKFVHSSVQLQDVSVQNVAGGSSVDSSTVNAALNLRQLLSSDGVMLNQIQYHRATQSSQLEASGVCAQCLAHAGETGRSTNRSDLNQISRATSNQPPSGRHTPADLNAYSDLPTTQDLIRSAEARTHLRYNRRTRRYYGSKSTRSWTNNCWHYIKDAIYDAGLSPRGSLHTARASEALYELDKKYNNGTTRYGTMTNLLDTDPGLATDPDRAPVGSIIIYAGDSTHLDGDVQIRTENGYVADYYSPNAMIHQHNGSHFHIVGVMVQ